MDERPMYPHTFSTHKSFPVLGNNSNRRSKICTDAMGKCVIISGNTTELPRISVNYGVDFVNVKGVNVNSSGFSGCSQSSTGEYIYLTRGTESKVYRSTDKTNFSGVTVGTGPITYPNSLSCSKDGSTVLIAQDGKLYSSIDYGLTWSLIYDVSPNVISSTACSQLGDIWVVSILDLMTPSNSRVERCDNYGAGTWSPVLTGYPYYSVCCSSSGNRIYAVYKMTDPNPNLGQYMGWWNEWSSVPSVPLYGPPDNTLIASISCSNTGMYIVADAYRGIYYNSSSTPTNGSILSTSTQTVQNSSCISGYGRRIFCLSTNINSSQNFYTSDLKTDFGLDIVPISKGDKLYFSPSPQTDGIPKRTNMERPSFSYYI